MQITVKRGENPDTADVLTALSNTVFYEDGTPWRATPKQVESLTGVFGVSADRCEGRPSDEELDEIARWLAGERRGNAGALPINGVPEVDYAVIGSSALDLDGDLLDYDLAEVRVSRAILRQARQSFLVSDHSKLGRSAPARRTLKQPPCGRPLRRARRPNLPGCGFQPVQGFGRQSLESRRPALWPRTGQNRSVGKGGQDRGVRVRNGGLGNP